MISKTRISIFLFLILSIGLFKQVGICKSNKVNPKHSYHQTLIPTSKPISLQGVPLFFKMNNGQFDPAVKFKAKNKSYSLYLTDNEAVISLRSKGSNPNDGSVLRLQFKDINPNAKITGVDRLKGIINYYRGKNPKKWHTNVPTYAKVKYEDIYPGIDLIFYGNKGLLEYDLEVRPGADPSQIKFVCQGQKNMQLDGTGDLALEVGNQSLRIRKPFSYQKIKGKKINIPASFDFREDYISFQLAVFDNNKTLIIDPILEFSTYLGGLDTDRANSIAIDDLGNYYITGETGSDEFPLGNPINNPEGNYGAFVAKINSAGDTLEYVSNFGGPELPEVQEGMSGGAAGIHIKIDEEKNAYVVGEAYTADFPVTENAFDQTCGTDGRCDARVIDGDIGVENFPDIFAMKLDPIGQIIYSTYIGGEGDDGSNGMDIDDNGNVYISTGRAGLEYPTTHTFGEGGDDSGGSILKLNSEGSDLIFLSRLGNETFAHDILVDASNEIYASGWTSNYYFPASDNAFQKSCSLLDENPPYEDCHDAIIMKLNASCDEILYATFIGGLRPEYGDTIAVDLQKQIIISGKTYSSDFPIKNAFKPNKSEGYYEGDAFILKLNINDSSLIYSSYYGEVDSNEYVHDMEVDTNGCVYVSGSTERNFLPLVDPLLQPTEEQFDREDFLFQVDPIGNLSFSSYMRGSSPWAKNDLEISNAGDIIIAGMTHRADFPQIIPFQDSYSGEIDAFISKLSFNDTFLQDDSTEGILCIEAEHHMQNIFKDTHRWIYDNTFGYSGTGAMVTNPNDNTNIQIDFINNSPSLSYKANFVKTSRHYVWVRGLGPDSGSDSLHIGLDGIFVDSSDNFKGFEITGEYSWSDSLGAYIDIETPGLHTIDIYMRESGFVFDKIVLTTSGSYTPTDSGPDESVKYAEPIIYDINYLGCISEQCETTLVVTAHDPADGVLTYEWDEFNDGSVDGTGESFVFDPSGSSILPACDPYLIKLTVTSSASVLSTEEIVGITVKLAGDANGDGVVNILDKVAVRNAFGQSGVPGWIDADVDCNGVVNILDKVVVRNQFGQSGCGCP